jgi:uncharacterized protein (DUF1697 family)
MNTYIALLRGINVSGKNIIKMHDLKHLFESLNFENVNTYIQSGNVIFQSNLTDIKIISNQITGRIKNDFGFEVPVIINNLNYLTQILNNNPFNQSNYPEDQVLVTLLSDIPKSEHINLINSANYLPDLYVIIDNIIYLYCPNGYGRTKLTNTFFEKKLKLIATTRNIRTLNELIKIGESFK